MPSVRTHQVSDLGVEHARALLAVESELLLCVALRMGGKQSELLLLSSHLLLLERPKAKLLPMYPGDLRAALGLGGSSKSSLRMAWLLDLREPATRVSIDPITSKLRVR